MEININNTKEINELKKRLIELRNELLLILDKWFELINIVQPRIAFQYDSIFGELESEIDNKMKLAHKLERKSQLIHTKIKNGEKVTKNTIEFINKLVEREIEIVSRHNLDEKKSNPYSNNYYQYQNDLKNSLEKESISTCYRMIVKKLHPDVSDSKELFEKYWDNIQTAYKLKDENKVNLYYWSLCVIDDLVTKHNNAESIKTTIKKLENEVFKERNNLENTSMQNPYNLEEKLNDASWIIRRKRQLRDKIFQIDRNIIQNKHFLQNMIGSNSLNYCVA